LPWFRNTTWATVRKNKPTLARLGFRRLSVGNFQRSLREWLMVPGEGKRKGRVEGMPLENERGGVKQNERGTGQTGFTVECGIPQASLKLSIRNNLRLLGEKS